MTADVELHDDYVVMNDVVQEYLKGATLQEIAKRLKMKQKDVNGYLGRWQQIASQSDHIKARAKEAVTGADRHFSMVLDELWQVAESAKTGGSYRDQTTALSKIADVEKTRIGMLQQAGLLNDQELADEVAENRQKQEAIYQLLQDVASGCPNCKRKIMEGLTALTGQPVGIVVDGETG